MSPVQQVEEVQWISLIQHSYFHNIVCLFVCVDWYNYWLFLSWGFQTWFSSFSLLLHHWLCVQLYSLIYHFFIYLISDNLLSPCVVEVVYPILGKKVDIQKIDISLLEIVNYLISFLIISVASIVYFCVCFLFVTNFLVLSYFILS